MHTMCLCFFRFLIRNLRLITVCIKIFGEIIETQLWAIDQNSLALFLVMETDVVACRLVFQIFQLELVCFNEHFMPKVLHFNNSTTVEMQEDETVSLLLYTMRRWELRVHFYRFNTNIGICVMRYYRHIRHFKIFIYVKWIFVGRSEF